MTNHIGSCVPTRIHTERVNTRPCRSITGLWKPQDQIQESTLHAIRLASGPTEQNLHANETVTAFAFGVGLTSL